MKPSVSRRTAMIGGGAVAVIAGALVATGRLFHKPSAYDDLLAHLDDREADAKLGQAVLAEKGDIDAAKVAAGLREKLKHGALADIAAREAAEGKILEGKGWVLPESVAMLAALAAKEA